MSIALSKVIYVMGPPGAGKGTQARLLAQELGYRQFSTGNAFRVVAAQNTELGRRVREIIDRGYLAPPELAAEIVTGAVKDFLDRGEKLMFDGTPRTVAEAKIVDRFFSEHGYGRPFVVLIKVDQEEMKRRNSQRLFCLGLSGKEEDFAVYTEEDRRRCETLGGHVGRRADDDPEKLATRWDEFERQTLPIVKQYQQEGILHEVSGIGTIPEVHGRVMGVVQQYASS